MRTTLQNPMTTEVQKPEVQQLIRDCNATTHYAIGAVVVVYLDHGDVLIYYNDPREPMKESDGAHYGFEKDLDMDEVVEYNSVET